MLLSPRRLLWLVVTRRSSACPTCQPLVLLGMSGPGIRAVRYRPETVVHIGAGLHSAHDAAAQPGGAMRRSASQCHRRSGFSHGHGHDVTLSLTMHTLLLLTSCQPAARRRDRQLSRSRHVGSHLCAFGCDAIVGGVEHVDLVGGPGAKPDGALAMSFFEPSTPRELGPWAAGRASSGGASLTSYLSGRCSPCT